MVHLRLPDVNPKAVAQLPLKAISIFRKRHPPAGARPGTLVVDESSPPTEIFLMSFTPEEIVEHKIEDLSEIQAHLGRGGVHWFDVRGFRDEAVLRGLANALHIHPLTLEDAVNVPQRAKSELYHDNHVLIVRSPVVEPSGRIFVPQVAIVLSHHWIVTFQEHRHGFLEPVRTRIREGQGMIRQKGPDYVAYAVVDAMIDRFYPIVQSLVEGLEALEDDAAENPTPTTLNQIHQLRRQLLSLRRVGRPQRVALREIIAADSPFIGSDVKVFLRDVFDHIAHAVEAAESAHEEAIALTEVYLSTVNHRTNEVIRMLTIIGSIFIPLTFIVGVYGMNFEHMPELHSKLAYPLVWLFMLALSFTMLVHFRRRGWLGQPGPPPPPPYEIPEQDRPAPADAPASEDPLKASRRRASRR